MVAAAGMAACTFTSNTDFGKELYYTPKPEIETYAVAAVYTDSAMLRGSYNPAPGATPQEKGFLVSLETIPEDVNVATFEGENSQVIEVADPSTGDFQAMLYDLEIGFTYHFRAYAKKGAGYILGREYKLYADNLYVDPPTAPTGNVTVDNYRSATAEMTIHSFGGDNLSGFDKTILRIYHAGVYCWRTADQTLEDARMLGQSYPQPSFTTAECNLMTKGMQIEVPITGLEKLTEYSYCYFVQTAIRRTYIDPDTEMEMEQINYLAEVTGEVLSFMTEDIQAPVVVTNNATELTVVSATLNATLADDGDDPDNTVYGFVIALSGDAGDPEDEDYIAALKASSKIFVTNADADGKFSYVATGLTLTTDYCVVAFAQNSNPDVAWGEVLRFQTPAFTAAVAETGTNVAENTWSATLNGALTDTGGDPDVEWGFLIGTTSDLTGADTKRIVVAQRAMDGTGAYSYDTWSGTPQTLLDPGTQYYYAAFAKNEYSVDDQLSADIRSFTTWNLTVPEMTVTPMDYAYRTAVNSVLGSRNFTTNSAFVTLTVNNDAATRSSGIHPSFTTNQYGIRFGDTPGSLGSTVYATDFDQATGLFTVNITGLVQDKTYYLEPFATNATGSSAPLATPPQFRPAIDGGKQWRFDNAAVVTGIPGHGTTFSFEKMQQPADAPNLVYYELDPIEGADGITYYMLDRNLGALAAYSDDPASDYYYGNWVTAPTPPATELIRNDAVGYFYQYGLNTPSFSPYLVDGSRTSATQTPWVTTVAPAPVELSEIIDTTTEDNINYAWQDDGWPVGTPYSYKLGNPCPAGYVIPTIDQYFYMQETPGMVLDAGNFAATSASYFERFRISYSGRRQQGGNLLNNPAGTYMYDKMVWSKTCNRANGYVFGIRWDNVDSVPTLTVITRATTVSNLQSKVWSMPVRCMRKL